jgi:holo-[acyl-carrier protein] synthase
LSDSHQSRLVVGVDLVSVRDVAESLARFGERYTRRLFTNDEITYCLLDPESAPQRFAARFAAKEATMKLLRVRDAEVVSWLSIEVRRSPDGWCDLVLHGKAIELAAQAGVTDLALSMSHELDYATATVIGRRDQQPADRAAKLA